MENYGLIGFVIVLAATARWFWRAWRVNIPKTPLVFQSLLTFGIVLGAASIYLKQGDPFAWWALGFGAMLIFLTATGTQKIASGDIAVGDKIPSFVAVDENGDDFDSASLAGSRILLKFFRGHW